MSNETATEKIVADIAKLASFDIAKGVAERDNNKNSGKALVERLLDFGTNFPHPRNGDPKYVRSVYTACRWLHKMHDENFQVVDRVKNEN